MSLSSYYEQQQQAGVIQFDQQQADALQHFQVVLNALSKNKHGNPLLRSIMKPKLVTGLYVWGGVGIGKTFLMDCFYQNLPFKEKWRIHFHAFMQYIHHELKHHQGRKNPLNTIAKSLSKQYRVICFDEFIVTDIVDAMLLKNVLQALFDHGVCLVATSNTAPDELYKNGLQRTSFLPAIALLKQHTKVVHLSSRQDYRLIQIRKSGVYFTPDDAHAHEQMEKIFFMLAHDQEVSVDSIVIHERAINIIKRTSKIIWFDFNDICNIPRSQHDYLELAKVMKIVFISRVPVLQKDDKNRIALFIKLIDVLYDARIPVIFSAAESPEKLGKNLVHIADFERIKSRLIEMQSEKYFAGLLGV